LLAPDITSFVYIQCIKRNKSSLLLQRPADIFTVSSTQKRRFSPVLMLAGCPALSLAGRRLKPGCSPPAQDSTQTPAQKTLLCTLPQKRPTPTPWGLPLGWLGACKAACQQTRKEFHWDPWTYKWKGKA